MAEEGRRFIKFRSSRWVQNLHTLLDEKGHDCTCISRPRVQKDHGTFGMEEALDRVFQPPGAGVLQVASPMASLKKLGVCLDLSLKREVRAFIIF